MPNVKSAAKALRQNKKRRVHNRAQRATLRTSLKRAVVAAETAAAPEDSKAALEDAMSKLGKAGKRHLYHPRKAARLASRLQKRVNKILAAKS